LDEGLSARSVESFHNVLHKALDTAVRWGLIVRNVCDAVSVPHGESFEVVMLTIEQVRAFREALHGHRLEALFLLAIATGMRRGEIMGLKWQDIDFDKGVLQVRRILTRVPTKLKTETQTGAFIEAETKTRRSRRSIIIASFALDALKTHKVQQEEIKRKAGPLWQDHNYVFCTSIGTHLNPTRDLLDELKKITEKTGLPHFRFHDLRHVAATLLLSEGVHPKIVQEILGHSQISMTLDVYSHVLPNMQQDAMNRLNDLFITERRDHNG
jgi:integrase